jgi:hypothetical protein
VLATHLYDKLCVPMAIQQFSSEEPAILTEMLRASEEADSLHPALSDKFFAAVTTLAQIHDWRKQIISLRCLQKVLTRCCPGPISAPILELFTSKMFCSISEVRNATVDIVLDLVASKTECSGEFMERIAKEAVCRNHFRRIVVLNFAVKGLTILPEKQAELKAILHEFKKDPVANVRLALISHKQTLQDNGL